MILACLGLEKQGVCYLGILGTGYIVKASGCSGRFQLSLSMAESESLGKPFQDCCY